MNKLMTGPALALVLAAAGCGGSKKPTTTAKESPCVAAGANVAAQLHAAVASEDDATQQMARQLAPLMQKVMTERCQADAWTPAAIACVTSADANRMDACTKQLTPAQTKALEDAMQAEMSTMEGGAGTVPAAEAPPPGDGATADPCGGDE